MISGVAAGSAGLKSDVTDQEGVARRVSSSSGVWALAGEESGRVKDVLAVCGRGSLLVRMVRRQWRGIIALVSLTKALIARCSGKGQSS